MVRIPEYDEVLAWAKEMDRQVAERRIAGLGGRVAEVGLCMYVLYNIIYICVCVWMCGHLILWAKEMDRQVAERRIAGLGGRVAEVGWRVRLSVESFFFWFFFFFSLSSSVV